MTILATALYFCLAQAVPVIAREPAAKQRTIVTTDGEVDDQDSFLRMLLYANEFHLEGLIYSSSQWHYKGDGKGTTYTSEMDMTRERYGTRTDLRWPGTTWMQDFIHDYEKVYDNLILHDRNYPTPAYLKSIIKVGNIDFEGEMEKVTEGSDMIKNILLDNRPGSVYLQIWGGTNTVARALKSIEESYRDKPEWPDIYRKVSEKAILYTVLDQDATYQKYIAKQWPEIRVMYNQDQFWSFAYLWPRVVPEEIKPWLKGKWFAENIKFNHGPLLEKYYLWGDGTQIENDPEHNHGDTAVAKQFGLDQYDFISEGDSPAFLYLTEVGLGSLEDASYGGWGGRMVPSPTNPRRREDGKQVTDFNPFTGKQDAAYPQTRWIPAIQNDFAARADWCVKSYGEANHAPEVKLLHTANLRARPGTTVKISASASDPDHHSLRYNWWQYEEVGSYRGKVTIENSTDQKTKVVIPGNAGKNDTIHLILEVSDSGTPSLTRYQRVIITVI